MEEEPRRFCDINALIQTMGLAKFKLLTNSYLDKERTKTRARLCKKMRSLPGNISKCGKGLELIIPQLTKALRNKAV